MSLREDGWLSIDTPAFAWTIEALVRPVDGIPQILGLRLEPPRGRPLNGGKTVRDAILTEDRLRALPLQPILQAAAAIDAPDIARAMTKLRRRRRRLDEGHLRAVADVYRRALADGRPPRKAVALHWRVTDKTASSWLSKARKARLLGHATRVGVAGADETGLPT